MGFFKNLFTWWDGATLGTALFSALNGSKVGEDPLGNRYFEGKGRRWVMYAGANDVSRVPPEWYAWLTRQIDGVPDGSVVTPPDCALPPVGATEGAAVQGVNQENGASLIVTVTRPVTSLRARIDQLARCASFTIAVGGEAAQVSDVTVELPPAPPVDADDSYAVDQTVTPESSGASGTRTLTLLARIADVQVTASWQGIVDRDATPDTGQLDALFTGAVLKVRSQIPR